MTVSELIEKLQRYPQDYEVKLFVNMEYFVDLKNITCSNGIVSLED